MESEKPVLISKVSVLDKTITPAILAIATCYGIYLSLHDSGAIPFAIILLLLTVAPFLGSRISSVEVYKDKLVIKRLFSNSVTLLFDNITSWEEMSGWGNGSRTILYTKNMPLDSYSINSRDFENYQELKKILTLGKPLDEY